MTLYTSLVIEYYFYLFYVSKFQVIAAAKEMKVRSVGVELNPWLIIYSQIMSWRSGTQQYTSFMKKDLFKLDLSQYNNIVIFGVEEMVSCFVYQIIICFI